MRFPTRRSMPEGLPGVTGTVRMDRRTGSLVRRLRPGDIAVVDHVDLDHATAETLVSRGVVAVVNASSFISGRYPNLGPDLLARSGVVMLDGVGPSVFSALREGSTVRVLDGAVLAGSEELVSGHQLGAEEISAQMDGARSGLSTQLQSFTHNTTEFLRREQELLLHGQGLPETRTAMTGRPVLVVVHGYDYQEDLRRLRRFIREQRPVLIGVDAGADDLVAAGHRPDVVVVGQGGLAASGGASEKSGTVSDKTLREARDVVLHTDRSGRAVGADRLDRLGIRPHALAASGLTEDVALLLADAQGASVIVAVGTHATLDEFLDRQRDGLASTFLTRLRVGPKLVDAKGVPQLYAGRVRVWQLALVLLAALAALAAAIGTTPVGAEWWSSLGGRLSALLESMQGLFP